MKNVLLAAAFVSSLIGIATLLYAIDLGDSSKGSEGMGQVKKVERRTPPVIDDYDVADISLGVMQNGVGSVSTQDIWLHVSNKQDFDTLSAAVVSGQLVKFTYNQHRFRWQMPTAYVTHVEIIAK